MKKISMIIFILPFFALIANDITAEKTFYPEWYENLDQAADLAKQQGKGILIDFTGSDWCKWCKKLDAEVFSQSEFISYARNNLILVKIDFPQYKTQSYEVKAYNERLALTFRVSGYPTVVIINKHQQVVGYTGYREGGAGNYVQYIKSLLN